jgi:hypothetical protein
MLVDSPSHGKLSGTPPLLNYTADFGFSGNDRFSFAAVDAQGEQSLGKVNIRVQTGKIGVTVYEGFDCEPGSFYGKSTVSAFGFSDEWQCNENTYVMVDKSLGYRMLPATGGRIVVPGWGRNPPATRALDKAALARDHLLADGSELWFSAMVGVSNKSNRTNGSMLVGIKGRETAHVGFKFARGNLHALVGEAEGEGRSNNSRAGGITFAAERPHLVVGHCKWGGTSEEPDTVEIYRVLDIKRLGPTLLEKPISTATSPISQEQLDTLYFEANERFYLDEIRIGPTYESVLAGTSETSMGINGQQTQEAR